MPLRRCNYCGSAFTPSYPSHRFCTLVCRDQASLEEARLSDIGEPPPTPNLENSSWGGYQQWTFSAPHRRLTEAQQDAPEPEDRQWPAIQKLWDHMAEARAHKALGGVPTRT